MVTNQNHFEPKWLLRYRSRKILDVANFLSESVFEIRKTEARFLPNLGNGYLAHNTVFHFLGFNSEGCDRLADLVIFRFCSYIQCPIINLEASILHQTAQFLELNSQTPYDKYLRREVHGWNNNMRRIWINLQFASRYDPYVRMMRWWDMSTSINETDIVKSDEAGHLDQPLTLTGLSNQEHSNEAWWQIRNWLQPGAETRSMCEFLFGGRQRDR